MKNLNSLCCVLTSVYLGLISPVSLTAEETSVWLAGKAKTVSGGILWLDSQSAYDLEMKDSTGVAIGEKPPGGGDIKSIEFSGSQISPFRSTTPFPATVGKLKVELEAIIPDVAGGQDATLLRHGSMWEIRYNAKSMTLSFIIWHEDNVFSDVKVPVNVGEWEKISAEYNEEELILKVGTESAKSEPKSPLRAATGSAHLLVGASTTAINGENLPRIFTGSMANIRISLE